ASSGRQEVAVGSAVCVRVQGEIVDPSAMARVGVASAEVMAGFIKVKRHVGRGIDRSQFVRRWRRWIAGDGAGCVACWGQRVIVGQSRPPDNARLPRLTDLAPARLQVVSAGWVVIP